MDHTEVLNKKLASAYRFDGTKFHARTSRRNTVPFFKSYVREVTERVYDERPEPALKRCRKDHCIFNKFVRAIEIKPKFAITALTWSPNGRYLYVGTKNGDLVLFDEIDLAFMSITTAHSKRIRCLQYSEVTNFMLSCDDTGEIQYWQQYVDSVKKFAAHIDVVAEVSFAPFGTKFASCSYDQTVKIWDFATAECEKQYCGDHRWDINSVSWHPYKSLVVTGGRDGVLCWYDPHTATILKRQDEWHHSGIDSVKWNPLQDNYLATMGTRRIKIQDLRKLGASIIDYSCLDTMMSSFLWHPFRPDVFMTTHRTKDVESIQENLQYWSMSHPHTPIYIPPLQEEREDRLKRLSWKPPCPPSEIITSTIHPGSAAMLTTGGYDGVLKFWTF